uniref:Uncharacterized protein n=1 Tax=Caenorhabditis japonica TaxID=281687 RepID=A0A8R1E7J8_CAEJA
MDPRSFKISLLVVFFFTLIILYSFNTTPTGSPISRIPSPVVSGNVNAIVESIPEDFPDYKIDGMDRFKWYAKRWKEELKNEKPPKIDEVSLLRAYEYDVEYAISITTPNKYK